MRITLGGIVRSRDVCRIEQRCARCGEGIAAGESLWYVRMVKRGANRRVRRQLMTCCTECTPASLRQSLTLRRCTVCQRTFGGITKRRFCSEHCTWRWHNRRRRAEQDCQPRVIDCLTCGRSLVNRRSDAITCSPRCRQRLSRLRGRRTRSEHLCRGSRENGVSPQSLGYGSQRCHQARPERQPRSAPVRGGL
jgi:hypothetical protein